MNLNEFMAEAKSWFRATDDKLDAMAEAKKKVEAVNADLQSKVSSIEADRDKLQEHLQNAVEAIDQLKLESVNLAERNTALESQVEQTKAKVQEDANRISLAKVAEFGGQAVQSDGSEPDDAVDESLVDQYKAINDPVEKVNFWRANEEAILAESGMFRRQ